MLKYLKAAMLFILFLPFTSCSSSDSCTINNNYRIDYYSGGGFTGVESGITISCEGWAKFWKRNLNSLRQTTDSVTISSDKLKKISELMKNPELFLYNNKFAGNYTTHLVLMKDIQFNQITFNESDLPANMPDVIKDLINEIKGINK